MGRTEKADGPWRTMTVPLPGGHRTLKRAGLLRASQFDGDACTPAFPSAGFRWRSVVR